MTYKGMEIGDITTLPQVIGHDHEDPEYWYVFTGDSFCGFISLAEALKLSQQLREKESGKERG